MRTTARRGAATGVMSSVKSAGRANSPPNGILSVCLRAEVVLSPNPLQQAVADAAHAPGIVVIEGPMGCGKTEAALFAAQQLIISGTAAGVYFALPRR